MSTFCVRSKFSASFKPCIATPFTKSFGLTQTTRIHMKIRNVSFLRPNLMATSFKGNQFLDCFTPKMAPYYFKNTRTYHMSSQLLQQKLNPEFGVKPDFGPAKLSSSPNWKKYTKEEKQITVDLARELKDDFHELKRAGDELIDEAHGNIAQFFQSGEYQLCIEAADKYLEQTDNYSVDALQYKAMSLNKLGKFDEATEVFEQAKLYVEMYDLNDRGLHLDAKGDYDSALLCFDRVLEVMPKVAEVWMNKANSLSALGKHEEALDAIEEATDLDPEDLMIMWSRATILQVAGEYDDAILCLNDVLEKYPEKNEIHFCKGYCYAKMGKDEEAIRCFDVILDMNPQDADTLLNKAISLQNLERYEDALKTLKKIKEGGQTSHEVEYNEGICYSALGQFEAAITRYDVAIKMKPDFTDAYYNKGTACLYLEQPEKAMQCYDKVISLQDKNAHEAYYNKGVVLLSFNKVQEALDNFTAAAQTEHRVAAYHYCRGLCLTKLGRVGEAAEAVAVATKLDPNVVQQLQGVFAE